MKYAIVIADGMADYPQPELENKTPLEAAYTPYADEVARSGLLGVAQTVPRGFTPGSDITTLCLLGYEPRKYYPGRAPLEAANLGIELGPEDWVFRCNLVTVRDGVLEDFSAGHVSTEEAAGLLSYLNKNLSAPNEKGICFFTGKGYRNIMLYKGPIQIRARCLPPHDVVGQPLRKNLPRGKGSQVLIELMEKSYPLLKQHGINLKRLSQGKQPANMIWLWGQGQRPKMPTFKDKYGVTLGAAISAVDLIKGLARLLGWEVIEVPGATGY
ncbi:MAG TPA: 2,3-bisphosphoglycerate-independent phosphoglycerate mutase, partial [Candidatus Hypogeohydataceae bacterium YC41]